ncbi:ras guanine nucleotide exchange factor domain-containing protein [Mucor mucedo]|uniref:ras guanine nucleotide exchange factor domain-containing protein n=1 Tax=Mucor mucedo TaxID=29922 RepID=UPI002220522C|nr:ras guanine nucleotide exchange factor domain-containing protein [Mucor mucedo]KAI7876647.1 ras guanine nucleotide exchange factor domain-containing protein [Mucor mucedo]
MNHHQEISKSSNRLPLIPLSPLTQTSIEYAKALAQTTKALSETRDGTSSNTSNIIALLNKDLSKERENLDRLTKEIQNVQSQFLTDLNHQDIAREIAYINCSLFRLVVLNKSWISSFDKQSNIVPLLDFHRYLSHAFAHQVIYSAAAAEEEEEATSSLSKKKKRKSLNNNNNMIAQLIQIASLLLHIYRDFSGCTAILTSLQMPEVQRLESLWSQCSSKMLATYKELVTILSPQNNYEAYHQQLWLHTARFLNTPTLKSQMIAVPFMHAHLFMIRNLIHTHSVVLNNSTTGMGNKQILSDAGKKSFVSAIRVLEFCQQHLKINTLELERSSWKRTSHVPLKLSVCLELDKLQSNSNLFHWLVSRAYLNRSQLHQESLNVEPLAVGEIELTTEEDRSSPKNRAASDRSDHSRRFSDSTDIPNKKPVEPEEVDDMVDDDNETDIIIAEEEEEEEEEPIREVKPKPYLSPTAPEFIPQQYLQAEEDMVILAQQNNSAEEEDEVWMGYPPSSHTDDDDEWRGYPYEEDEEEVWKGYPAPQITNKGQASPRTIDLSTPSTPQEEVNKSRFGDEEWKGYRETSEEHTTKKGGYQIPWNSNHNLHAIGKAAARKMQCSLSSTDNRKRLPSSFTPSTST